MDRDFTLTELTEINGQIDGLSFQEARALHRRLKDFARLELVVSHDTRGKGEKAPALFSLHELAKSRVMSKLIGYGMDATAIKAIFAVPDHRVVADEVRKVSGLENAIADALRGVDCVAHFDMLNGNNRVRGRFISEGDASLNADIASVIENHDAITGTRVVSRLSLDLAEIVRPIQEKVSEIAASPPSDLPPTPRVPSA